jgi:hypothetical protein
MIGSRASRWSTMMLLMSLIVLPQSYTGLKIVILGVFVLVHAIIIAMKAESFLMARDLLFYGLLSAVAIVWSIVGALRGSPVEAILASVRLYFGWSVAYLLILTFIRNTGREDVLHKTIVLSVFAIAALNLFALTDATLFDSAFLGDSTRKELGLVVELYGGYVRFGANNIASLFFLVGYLVAFKCFNRDRRDRAGSLALLVGIVVAALSGRRALWLAIFLMPAVIFGLATLAGLRARLAPAGKGILIIYGLGILLAGLVFLLLGSATDVEVFDYLKAAFSSEDERSIQAGYLIEAFKRHPLIGSGFGGYAGYLRNSEAPWLYELTYYQILFNLGLVGATALLAGFAYFLHLALDALRRSGANLALHFGLLVGYVSILIGSHSNPYMQFFDAMAFTMLFVLLAGSAGPVIYLRHRPAPNAVLAS